MLSNPIRDTKIGYFEILGAAGELKRLRNERAVKDAEIQRKANDAWQKMHESLRKKGLL